MYGMYRMPFLKLIIKFIIFCFFITTQAYIFSANNNNSVTFPLPPCNWPNHLSAPAPGKIMSSRNCENAVGKLV